MNIPDKLKTELIKLAKQNEPREMCGFVILNGGELEFINCENIADDPENFFEVSPDDFLSTGMKGNIVALVHSHPGGEPVLSPADFQMQQNTALDWWLVCNGEIHVFPWVPPLLGREFIHGKMDCYTLFRDFYRLAGREFPNFERDDYWWEDGFNLYMDHMEEQGFDRLTDVKELQVGDVILIQVGSDVPNHAAIYIGDQMVLHHSPRRLSKRDLYDGYWLKHTHSLWRFKEWSQLNFTAALNNLAVNLSSM